MIALTILRVLLDAKVKRRIMEFLVDQMPELHDAIRSIRTSLHVHSPTSVIHVLEIVARKAAEVLDARGALVRIVNVETHKIAWRAAHGLGEAYVRKGPATNLELITDLCQRNEVVVVSDILNDPRIQRPQEAWDEGIRMMLDVPLIVQSPLVGLLRLHFSETRNLGQVEKNFMISIAEQLASAIDKAQLIEIQRIEYDHLALHTEKLSALGRMAAGIAHEINNPLAGIMLYGSRLSKKVPRDGPVFEGLNIIVDEATRCRGIIQNLLEFSRDREPRKEPTDILNVLDKAVAVVENELHLHQIKLERTVMEGLPEVCVDANQMEQVFINLLLNAAEAIGHDGTVTIAGHVEKDTNRLILQFSDTGCGMSPEIVERIFEPFYSTKAKGTGLGLSVTYGIVRSHMGNITVSSEPEQGTQFTVVIPAQRRAKVGSDDRTAGTK